MKQTLPFFSKKTFNKILFIGFFAFLSNIQAVNAQSVTLTPNGAWVPSLTTTARTTLSATATDGQLVYDNTTKSFWYFNATEWKEINTASGDNLGNHIATQTLNVGSNYITNGTGSNGLKFDANGSPTFINSNAGYAITTIDGSNSTNTRLSLKTSSDKWNLNGQNNKFYIHSSTADYEPFGIESPTSNDLLYLKNNKVGILTDSPTETLDVNGKTKTTTFQMTNGASANYVLKTDDNGNASWANIATFYSETDPQVTSSTNNYIPKWNGTSLADGIIYDNGTNIGIGTASPNSKLDIQGSGQTTINNQSSGSHAYFVNAAPSGFETSLLFKTHISGTNYNRWAFGKSVTAESGSNAGSDFYINAYNDAGAYSSQPFNITRSTGQVNIGLLSATTAKATTLNVSGAVMMAVTTKTASYSVGDADYIIIFTGITAGQTITLPLTPVTGRVLMIINHSTEAVNLSPAPHSGSASTVPSSGAGNELQIVYDGTNWRVIN